MMTEVSGWNQGVNFSQSSPKESEKIDQIYLAVREKIETHPEFRTLDVKVSETRLVYRAAILAGAQLRFVEARANFSHNREVSRIVEFPNKGIDPDWNAILVDYDPQALTSGRDPDGHLAVETGKSYRAEDFADFKFSFVRHLLQTEQESIYFNPHLTFYSRHDEGLDDFVDNCHEQGKKIVEQEASELLRKIKTRLGRMKQKEQDRFRQPDSGDEPERRYRILEKFDVFLTRVVNHYFTVWQDPRAPHRIQPVETQGIREKTKLFFQEDLKDDMTVELAELRDEVLEGLHAIDGRYQDITGDVERIDIRLLEKDIDIFRFALLWVPYLEVCGPGGSRLLKAF